MAVKHFTLAVVILLAGMAFGQDPQPSQGDSNLPDAPSQGSSTPIQSPFAEQWPANFGPMQISDMEDLTYWGPDNGGMGGTLLPYSGGDIPFAVLSDRRLQQAGTAVNTMGGVAAAAGATAVGGPLAGINVLLSMFPHLQPGCDGCAVRMVTPTGGVGAPNGAGFNVGADGNLVGWDAAGEKIMGAQYAVGPDGELVISDFRGSFFHHYVAELQDLAYGNGPLKLYAQNALIKFSNREAGIQAIIRQDAGLLAHMEAKSLTPGNSHFAGVIVKHNATWYREQDFWFDRPSTTRRTW